MSTYDRAYSRRHGELAAEWEWRQHAGASDEEDPVPFSSAPTKTVRIRAESKKARQYHELAEAADELAAQLLEKHMYEVAEEKREKRRRAEETKREAARQTERELAATRAQLESYQAYVAEQERRRQAEEVAFRNCCTIM